VEGKDRMKYEVEDEKGFNACKKAYESLSDDLKADVSKLEMCGATPFLTMGNDIMHLDRNRCRCIQFHVEGFVRVHYDNLTLNNKARNVRIEYSDE